MKKARIIVHCLVANEERFIWYAINSVLPFIDKIMIWDTGSSDDTLKIIKSIHSPKIDFRELGIVDAERHTELRDQMLQATPKDKYDWLLILDGDEVWPAEMFKKTISEAEKKNPSAIVVKTINFVGDIYHREPDSAGHYHFADRVGHYNLRLINLTLPKLHVSGPHGKQGYYSDDDPLQTLSTKKLLILDDVYYFHATHLLRSRFDQKTTKRSFKRKYEFGVPLSHGSLPKIFFEHPIHVPVISNEYDFGYWLKAFFETIPRRIKRLLFPPNEGY